MIPQGSFMRRYYSGARYYDPTTARFVTQDSVVGKTSDPPSLNRYVYARDNPMKIVDMNGHEWWDPVANLVSAAVGIVTGAATDLANAASDAGNSLPPAVSTFSNSASNYVQSTASYITHSVSSGINGLSDAMSRTWQGGSGVLSTVHSDLQSSFSSLSAFGENEPIVDTVTKLATSPVTKVVAGAGLIFIGIFRMAAPFLGGEGPVEPVPTGDPSISAAPPVDGGVTFGPKPGYLSSLLESEVSGGAIVAAGMTLEFSGAYQLGCQTDGRCL